MKYSFLGCFRGPERLNRRGFTLIELLIVVAIIALLIAILMPTLRNAKEAAKRVVCAAHLKNIGLAMHYYADDHRRHIPPSGNAGQYVAATTSWIQAAAGQMESYGVLHPYLNEPTLYGCPSAESAGYAPSYGTTFPARTPEALEKEWQGAGWKGTGRARAAYIYRETMQEASVILDENSRRGLFMDTDHLDTLEWSHWWEWVNILYGDGHVSGALNTPVLAERFTYNGGTAFEKLIWQHADEHFYSN
ncbi:DUF1559 domain-containing protein [Planctomycetales bacterium ZRK34]|nr:DUF1559 domain-containing protein [Planctomycetales bacterium ZRK34]